MDDPLVNPVIVNKKLGYLSIFIVVLLGVLPGLIMSMINSGLVSYTDYYFHPFFKRFLFPDFSLLDIGFYVATALVFFISSWLLKKNKYTKNFSLVYAFLGLMIYRLIINPLAFGVYNWASNHGAEGLNTLPILYKSLVIILYYGPLILAALFMIYAMLKFIKGDYAHIYGYSISLGILLSLPISFIYEFTQGLNLILCFLGASCFNGIG